MRKIFLIALTLIAASCNSITGSSSANDSIVDSNTLSVVGSNLLDSVYVYIDSTENVNGVFDYLLILKSANKKEEVYRIKNQDNSIEFTAKYRFNNKTIKYKNFEIADLPTGLTWNILFDEQSRDFYITDKYDKEALGDTLDRETVDFTSKSVAIVSNVNKNRYHIDLKRIYDN